MLNIMLDARDNTLVETNYQCICNLKLLSFGRKKNPFICCCKKDKKIKNSSICFLLTYDKSWDKC